MKDHAPAIGEPDLAVIGCRVMPLVVHCANAGAAGQKDRADFVGFLIGNFV
jgi:hypothetical protein